MDWPLRNVDNETFNSLDQPTRQLILRLLGSEGDPTEADWRALEAHPQGKALASWLLSLPAYVNALEADPEADDYDEED